MRDIGVLGGGISGLFVARFLGGDVEVLEADDRVGGLARCFGKGGFLSDIGGHILFSKDKEALAHEHHALEGNLRQGVRANRVLYNGLHVKYPFENGIDALPKEEIVDILHSFIENPHKEKPTNFREWMFHVFGDGLTNKYLLPYNEKIWKTPPEQMSLEWVDRVPRPPLRDLDQDRGRHPHRGVHAPALLPLPRPRRLRGPAAHGGGEARGKITTGFRVQKLRRVDGGFAVTSASGEERSYRQIIATLPITTLFAAMDDVPPEVTKTANALRYNSLRVALIGVEGENLPPYTALYVPDPKSLYHRVCYNQVFSPHNVPKGKSSVSCEITVAPGSELDQLSDEVILDRVTGDLVRDGIVDKKAVVYRDVHRERFAYVIYDLGYADRVRVIRDFTASRGIHLAGRFAEYQYVNTDACVRRALDLARELRGGDIAPEARLPDAVR